MHYNRAQLPLVYGLRRTFPKLFAANFVIVNTDTECVLHESTAEQEQSWLNFRIDVISHIDDVHYTVYQYKNVNGCNFVVVLYYNEPILDNIQLDKECINKWLDMFYVNSIACTKCGFANTHLLYADCVHNIPVVVRENIKILTTKLCRVKKVLQYKTVTKAPVNFDTQIGKLDIYSIFENPVSIKINAGVNVKKVHVYKRLFESVKYLVFGANAN